MKPKAILQMMVRRMGVRVPAFLLDNATRDMRRLAETFTRDDVVLDLGAHVGNATTEFAHRAKHVHAFEPNPENFKKLQEQTSRYRNVTLHNIAAYDRNEKVTLYFEDGRRGKYFEGSTILANKSNISYRNGIEVNAVDISEFISSLEEPVACIKIDIEGAEYRVLRRLIETGQLEKIGRVFVECHVDRIPDLAIEKESVLAAAKAAGVINKIDFSWQ